MIRNRRIGHRSIFMIAVLSIILFSLVKPSRSLADTVLPPQVDDQQDSTAWTNLLGNSGFEDGAARDFLNWTFSPSNTSCSRAQHTNAWPFARTGERFLGTGRTSTYPNCFSVWQEVWITPQVGQTYTAGFWMRNGTNVTPAQSQNVVIALWAIGPNGEVASETITVTDFQWSCHQLWLTPTRTGNTRLKVEIYLDKTWNTDIHADDLFLTEGRVDYCNADTTPPDGVLLTPVDGATTGPGTVNITANAWDNTGGIGVKQVEFYALYDGSWHLLSSDNSPPYAYNWTLPSVLRSQQIKLTMHVLDHVGNRKMDPGGYRNLNFIESVNNPGLIERWVPESKRAYLNQRSLSPSGDSKCGSAGAAMVLAMNGKIGRNYEALRDTANAIYPNTVKNGDIWLYLITQQMRNRGVNAREKNVGAEDGWNTIKSEIGAGRPVMLLSRKVTAGHFFVVVGYREEGSSRKIIVYDPYGRWLGTYRSYDRNTTASDSRKGQWVLYDYNASWGGGWLVTASPYGSREMDIDSTSEDGNPDPVSDEPLEEVVFDSPSLSTIFEIFMPLLEK